MNFKLLKNHQNVDDIVKYVKDILTEKPYTKVYVGTDSQNARRNTIYATVIVLHYLDETKCGKGGHVLYNKEIVPKIRDRYSRLWGEVERSLFVGNMLKDNNISVKNIDLDFNEDPKYNSNTVLRAAVGYVEASGFVARWKPHDAFSCRIADVICK